MADRPAIAKAMARSVETADVAPGKRSLTVAALFRAVCVAQGAAALNGNRADGIVPEVNGHAAERWQFSSHGVFVKVSGK
jgi:hypothetical protein